MAGAARLQFHRASPFGRMARVLVREWRLPVEEREQPTDRADWLYELNGWSPVLTIGDDRVYETCLVPCRLWEMAGSPLPAYTPVDRRPLAIAILVGEELVAALDEREDGRRPIPNNPDLDLRAFILDRAESSLNWLGREGHVRRGLTLPGVALACGLLWSDARGGPSWRGRGPLERVVSELAERSSFRATEPDEEAIR